MKFNEVCVCVAAHKYSKHPYNSLTGHVWLYNPLEMMPLVQYDHIQSCSGLRVLEWTEVEKEGRGEGGGVEQEALYNDWVFTQWLIVLHRPGCGLKRPALMFAEWCTVLSQCTVTGCHVGMSGVLPPSNITYISAPDIHCQSLLKSLT